MRRTNVRIQNWNIAGATVIPVFCGGSISPSPQRLLTTAHPTPAWRCDLHRFALIVARPLDIPRPSGPSKPTGPYMVPCACVSRPRPVGRRAPGLPRCVALQSPSPNSMARSSRSSLARMNAQPSSPHLQDRVEAIAERVIRWPSAPPSPASPKKLRITVFSFPPEKG